MKKVLIVSSSLRYGSNSEILAHEAERAAIKNKNEVSFLNLKGKVIKFCIGCLSCQKSGQCVLKDDMAAMIEQVSLADVLVFVTPIYYYGISGQLKTFLDRCNPLYIKKNNFKEVYMITTSAELGEEVAQRAIHCVEGWIECFEGVKFKGIYSAGGVNKPNSVASDEDLMKGAYQFGLKF